MLKEAGWNVTAVTMSIYDGSIPIPESDRSGCFGPREKLNILSAQRAAERIGIPHLVINLANEYRQSVLDYFRSEYLAGRTPNPCVHCNRKMKFGFLQEQARKRSIAFDYFATGHYARVVFNPESSRYCIMRGKDPTKDQSYFISHLTQKQLSTLLFPLGELRKEEVKEIARKLGWNELLERSESQDFIACDDYSPLFQKEDCRPGNFVDVQGKILGRHRGIIFYTIGQRKGIGIGGGIPFYVLRIDPRSNTITLGKKEELLSRTLVAKEMNWCALAQCPATPLPIQAQIRQRHKAAPALLCPGEGDTVKIVFDTPQTSVTPGQIVALYEGDTLLGAGTIASAGNS